MSARLEIDALRALKAVVDHGGVTRASGHLALTQSAVSHKLRRLEDAVGVQLLRRRPGAPPLTEDGQRLLHYAERIVSLHDEALAAMGRKALDGEIRLGLTEDTTSLGLSRILARFARLYPSASVTTRVDQSLQLARDVDQGAIDLAVIQVFETEVNGTDIVIDTDDLVWARSVDHDPCILAPIPFIAFDTNCFYRQWAYTAADEGKLPADLRTVLQCASIRGVCEAVASGLGVAIINRRYVDHRMTELEDAFPTPPRVAYIARPAPSRHSEAIQALTDQILDENRGAGI